MPVTMLNIKGIVEANKTCFTKYINKKSLKWFPLVLDRVHYINRIHRMSIFEKGIYQMGLQFEAM